MFFTLIGDLCFDELIKHLHCKNNNNENWLNYFINGTDVFVGL